MAYLEEPYYYFISALPYLYLGQEPPLSSADFLQRAVGVMDPSTVYQLEKIGLVPRELTCCDLEQHWANFDTYIRNFLGCERAAQKKKDFREWQRSEGDAFSSVRPKLDEAYNTDDPVQCEWMLDSLRWWFLDHLTAVRVFSFDAVVAYRVKLLLTEKWAAVSVEAGRQHLQELLEDVWQEAEQTREAARERE